jgi:hypothetical protein
MVCSLPLSISQKPICCCADENKSEIRLLGGLLPIIECLDISDIRTRRDALRTLCNLSIDGTFDSVEPALSPSPFRAHNQP